jgi:transposase
LLLDDGLSCEQVAKVLYLDDAVRSWRTVYDERGVAGLTSFDVGGSASRLWPAQEEALKAYVAANLPRPTRKVGCIEKEFGVVYESRSGLIALLHRLGLEYHKPEIIGRKLDEEKQKAFIEAYENLLNSLGRERPCYSPTPCVRRTPRGPWAAGRRARRSSRSSRRAGVNTSIFTARSTWRLGEPA